jgi:hypothetical protein
MKNVLLLLFLVLFVSTANGYPLKPNIKIAPGHMCSVEDKDFDRFRYEEQIPYCRRNVSVKTKNRICAAYGVFDRTGYTIDHIVPLSLGGSNSVKNLWCQSRKIYTGNIEYQLYKEVSKGLLTQAGALLRLLPIKYDPDAMPLDHELRPLGLLPDTQACHLEFPEA